MSGKKSDDSIAAKHRKGKKGRQKEEKAISKEDDNPYEKLLEEPEASSSSKAAGTTVCSTPSIAPTSSTSTVADTVSPIASTFSDIPSTSTGLGEEPPEKYNLVFRTEEMVVCQKVDHLDEASLTAEAGEIVSKINSAFERYMNTIISTSEEHSNTEGRPIWVPCFDPSEPHQTDDDDTKYHITLRNPTEAALETFCDTAAEVQALNILKQREGLQTGLDRLNKFATEFNHAFRIYRDACISRVLVAEDDSEIFHYVIEYGTKTEEYRSDVLRQMIVDQIPGHQILSSAEKARSKLRNKLHDMQQMRRRKS